MKVEKLHHIAVAVKNIEEALGEYADVLGLPRSEIQFIESQQVKATLIPVGDAEIELIEPTDPEGGIAKFLERRGEGLHHICFQVADVDHELSELEKKGLQLIDKQSRPGLAGMVGFLHPRSTKGVLTELCTPLAKEQ
ncbi:MAG: methylmalonyl-CoA epimerase [Chloroflexi bacterium]|nr:methylmalonyl-CoA epimerase [Chloroflexota bacterium]MCH8195471.1 methylmalonyl-CoA epimerase [Chloroflexota bacterium]MCH8284155.1 methylmalonyl-CoA epimerase [Chloroflexota bacterium]